MENLELSSLRVRVKKGGNLFVLLHPFNFYFYKESLSDELIKELQDSKILQETQDKKYYFIQVRSNFITDFGSVPRLFQNIISPIGKPIKAYVLHDYLCFLNRSGALSRKMADDVFKIAMQTQGVCCLKQNIIYLFVRLQAKLRGRK
ncbi:MAG: DUF1353 domain-containing protein [Helicobacteraceae bacterium]|nr:DUF1353 domain-containing protein [Helicobacteraceae bacterium]